MVFYVSLLSKKGRLRYRIEHLLVFIWLVLLALPCSVQGRQLSFTSYAGVVEEATLPNSAAKYDGKQFEDLIGKAEATKGSKIDSAIIQIGRAHV